MKACSQDVLIGCLLCFAATAHAARPFVTDDARVVDRGSCQIETFTKSQRAYKGSEEWMLPACNPFGVELTYGWNRIKADSNTIVQGKFVLKELTPNDTGHAVSVGSFGGEPYVIGIGSFSFFDDRSVMHANLGAIRSEIGRITWGIGFEQMLIAPRLYGIFETYGQTADKPTLHLGLRFWALPGRLQIDSTVGRQRSSPEQRFFTVGLRILF
jgi:hypothetical protein